MTTSSDQLGPDKIEAVQAVVDRVSSYQDGATEGTVESELRGGLSQAGVELQADQVSALASAIEAEHGSVDAARVLVG
jgi:hypothetical protein